MEHDIDSLCIGLNNSIQEAISRIDQNGQGIALVVGKSRRLIGVITDGDIRRAILAELDLTLPIEQLLEQKSSTAHYTPLTARTGTPDSELLRLMNQDRLRHIPIVDHLGRVVDVALMSDLVKGYELPIEALIMAGGSGTRLRPLTEDIPKPMLPVGDKPMMEWVVDQLKSSGINRLSVSTHYKPEVITSHFGDGKQFGVEISYVEETHPLGTAGAVGLLPTTEEPLLVINGDILTQVDFRSMLDFHRDHEAEMTLAVRQHEITFPFGIVETNEIEVTDISEKPVLRHIINAGIYLLSPYACQSVPKGTSFDMPELIRRLIAEGRRVISFPVHEYWLDIGQHADYQEAQKVKDTGR